MIQERQPTEKTLGFLGDFCENVRDFHEISMRYPTLPQEGAFMEALKVTRKKLKILKKSEIRRAARKKCVDPGSERCAYSKKRRWG